MILALSPLWGWSKNLLTLGQGPPSCRERDCLTSKWSDFYLLIIIIIIGQKNLPENLNFVNCILDTFTHVCAKRASETNRNCKGREGCVKDRWNRPWSQTDASARSSH